MFNDICNTDVCFELSQGYFTIVEEQDVFLLSSYKWYANINNKRNSIYARSQIGYLHRWILMNAGIVIPYNYVVDHINRNSLDNRRRNLRLATLSLNAVNRGNRILKI